MTEQVPSSPRETNGDDSVFGVPMEKTEADWAAEFEETRQRLIEQIEIQLRHMDVDQLEQILKQAIGHAGENSENG